MLWQLGSTLIQVIESYSAQICLISMIYDNRETGKRHLDPSRLDPSVTFPYPCTVRVRLGKRDRTKMASFQPI